MGSLSMISFGFTMVKFFEYLAEERKVGLVGVLGLAALRRGARAAGRGARGRGRT